MVMTEPIDYAALCERFDTMVAQYRKEYPHHYPSGSKMLEEDAADAIRALLAENAKLREALTPRWDWPEPTFGRLMFGRVELAQINKGATTDNWFYVLHYTVPEDRALGGKSDKESAMQIAEHHARKALNHE